jgi:hypothetical protein
VIHVCPTTQLVQILVAPTSASVHTPQVHIILESSWERNLSLPCASVVKLGHTIHPIEYLISSKHPVLRHALQTLPNHSWADYKATLLSIAGKLRHNVLHLAGSITIGARNWIATCIRLLTIRLLTSVRSIVGRLRRYMLMGAGAAQIPQYGVNINLSIGS